MFLENSTKKKSMDWECKDLCPYKFCCWKRNLWKEKKREKSPFYLLTTRYYLWIDFIFFFLLAQVFNATQNLCEGRCFRIVTIHILLQFFMCIHWYFLNAKIANMGARKSMGVYKALSISTFENLVCKIFKLTKSVHAKSKILAYAKSH